MLLRSLKTKRQLIQLGFVSTLVVLLLLAVLTAQESLAAQGMTTGFDFFNRSTGWDISFSLISFEPNDTYVRALFVGLTNTILLAVVTLPLATLIGMVIAVMRTSGMPIFELAGASYVELFRNIPVLLQLLFWYHILRNFPPPKTAEPFIGAVYFTGRGIFLPAISTDRLYIFSVAFIIFFSVVLWIYILISKACRRISRNSKNRLIVILWFFSAIGITVLLWIGRGPDTSFVTYPVRQGLGFVGGGRITPEISALIVAISIYGSAYIAEIVRAGLISVPKGLPQAGYSLGLTSWHVFSRIRFPLALRSVLPTMINQYVWLTKATTLGIAVGFADYFMVISTSINQSGQTLELIALLMGGFLIINYALSWLLNQANQALKLQGNQISS